jgi:hypothetical protein
MLVHKVCDRSGIFGSAKGEDTKSGEHEAETQEVGTRETGTLWEGFRFRVRMLKNQTHLICGSRYQRESQDATGNHEKEQVT